MRQHPQDARDLAGVPGYTGRAGGPESRQAYVGGMCGSLRMTQDVPATKPALLDISPDSCMNHSPLPASESMFVFCLNLMSLVLAPNKEDQA